MTAVSLKCECHWHDFLSFLPSKLRHRLMPFQREGIKFVIEKGGRCLIADEMGLGKTLQAICVAYYFKSEWPMLIVVPSSMKYIWVEEIEKWFPEILPQDINLLLSTSDLSDIPHAMITIATYGLIRNHHAHVLIEALFNQNFKVIIVDESHYIKNRLTASCKVLMPLIQQAQRRILITGTPALARPDELYAQLESILPGHFGSWSGYTKRYCDAKFEWIGRVRKWRTDGASNLDELQFRLSHTLMIRRLKKDVLKQLPPKRRQRIPFELKESKLKKELDGVWEQLNPIMENLRMNVVDFLKVADDGNLKHGSNVSEMRGMVFDLYRKTCRAKIGPVVDYVKLLLEDPTSKFLVFAHHHEMMDAIQKELVLSKVEYIRIDGNTMHSDRARLVHAFQSQKKIRVAVLSILAAGVGLTFTAASLVVFAELHWTPGVLVQCEDRAHRIGQTNPVNIHYLVAKGSVDEWVWASIKKKTVVVSTVLNGRVESMGEEVIREGQKVSCLSNADVYTAPDPVPSQEIPQLFDSQENLPSTQTQITDFFGRGRGNATPRMNSPIPRAIIMQQNRVVTIDDSSDDDDLKDMSKKVVFVSKKGVKSTSTVKKTSTVSKTADDSDCEIVTELEVNKDTGISASTPQDSSKSSCSGIIPKISSTRHNVSALNSNLDTAEVKKSFNSKLSRGQDSEVLDVIDPKLSDKHHSDSDTPDAPDWVNYAEGVDCYDYADDFGEPPTSDNEVGESSSVGFSVMEPVEDCCPSVENINGDGVQSDRTTKEETSRKSEVIEPVLEPNRKKYEERQQDFADPVENLSLPKVDQSGSRHDCKIGFTGLKDVKHVRTTQGSSSNGRINSAGCEGERKQNRVLCEFDVSSTESKVKDTVCEASGSSAVALVPSGNIKRLGHTAEITSSPQSEGHSSPELSRKSENDPSFFGFVLVEDSCDSDGAKHTLHNFNEIESDEKFGEKTEKDEGRTSHDFSAMETDTLCQFQDKLEQGKGKFGQGFSKLDGACQFQKSESGREKAGRDLEMDTDECGFQEKLDSDIDMVPETELESEAEDGSDDTKVVGGAVPPSSGSDTEIEDCGQNAGPDSAQNAGPDSVCAKLSESDRKDSSVGQTLTCIKLKGKVLGEKAELDSGGESLKELHTPVASCSKSADCSHKNDLCWQNSVFEDAVPGPSSENTESSIPVDKWNCQVCTFLNHVDLPYCEICETAKPVLAKTLALKNSAVKLNQKAAAKVKHCDPFLDYSDSDDFVPVESLRKRKIVKKSKKHCENLKEVVAACRASSCSMETFSSRPSHQDSDSVGENRSEVSTSENEMSNKRKLSSNTMLYELQGKSLHKVESNPRKTTPLQTSKIQTLPRARRHKPLPLPDDYIDPASLSETEGGSESLFSCRESQDEDYVPLTNQASEDGSRDDGESQKIEDSDSSATVVSDRSGYVGACISDSDSESEDQTPRKREQDCRSSHHVPTSAPSSSLSVDPELLRLGSTNDGKKKSKEKKMFAGQNSATNLESRGRRRLSSSGPTQTKGSGVSAGRKEGGSASASTLDPDLSALSNEHEELSNLIETLDSDTEDGAKNGSSSDGGISNEDILPDLKTCDMVVGKFCSKKEDSAEDTIIEDENLPDLRPKVMKFGKLCPKTDSDSDGTIVDGYLPDLIGNKMEVESGNSGAQDEGMDISGSEVCEENTPNEQAKSSSVSLQESPRIAFSTKGVDHIKRIELTPSQNTNLVAAEVKAAMELFSPKLSFRTAKDLLGDWKCVKCGYKNCASDDDCDSCFSPKPATRADSTRPCAKTNGAICKDWKCVKCGYQNCPSDDDCDKCFSPKPAKDNQISLKSMTFTKVGDESLGKDEDLLSKTVRGPSLEKASEEVTKCKDRRSEVSENVENRPVPENEHRGPDVEAMMDGLEDIFNRKVDSQGQTWTCLQCGHHNCEEDETCDECFQAKPKPCEKCIKRHEVSETRTINLDEMMVHSMFLFCCSKNTSRIFVYDKNGDPLNINFIPIDVETGNLDDIPDLLLHPRHMKLIKAFVNEWNSLTATKRRIVLRHGMLFRSPLAFYEEVKSKKNTASKQRYKTKVDIAEEAMAKATELNGSVRIIERPKLTNAQAKVKFDETLKRLHEVSKRRQRATLMTPKKKRTPRKGGSGRKSSGKKRTPGSSGSGKKRRKSSPLTPEKEPAKRPVKITAKRNLSEISGEGSHAGPSTDYRNNSLPGTLKASQRSATSSSVGGISATDFGQQKAAAVSAEGNHGRNLLQSALTRAETVMTRTPSHGSGNVATDARKRKLDSDTEEHDIASRSPGLAVIASDPRKRKHDTQDQSGGDDRSKKPRMSMECVPGASTSALPIDSEGRVLFSDADQGFVQAVNKDGVPLCLHCHTPISNQVLTDTTIRSSSTAWQLRLCSRKCKEKYWLKTSRSYGRNHIFEIEHGVCQMCNFDAEDFFKKLKGMRDSASRAALIKQSPFRCLSADVKQRMVKDPKRGMFWHVDHIKPVVEGGGECDIDNLRTLCYLCHRDVTKQQHRERAIERRNRKTGRCADLTEFFRPKME